MNKEKQRRSLIWKYFWKRKRKEVRDFFDAWGSRLIVIQLGVLIILSVVFGLPLEETGVSISPFLGKLFLFLVLIEIIIFFLGWVIGSITGWVKSNWMMATEDAVRELNKRRRK